MNHVLMITAYRRPVYTQQVLDALAQCSGVEKYDIIVCLDPGFPAVREVLEKHPLKKELRLNPVRLGCGSNIRAAMDEGFSRSDYVILLEDDCVPAREFLRFHEFCRARFADDKNVLNANAYNRHLAPPIRWHLVRRRPTFTPWGWGTWRDRWQTYIRPRWVQPGQNMTWDCVVSKIARGDRAEVFCPLARVQNIGANAGEHVPSPEWHAANQFNEHWAGAVDVQDGDFHE